MIPVVMGDDDLFNVAEAQTFRRHGVFQLRQEAVEAAIDEQQSVQAFDDDGIDACFEVADLEFQGQRDDIAHMILLSGFFRKPPMKSVVSGSFLL